MIFDTIYSFFMQLFSSDNDVSEFWAIWAPSFWDPYTETYQTFAFQDYVSALCTLVVIVLGVYALFRILGGVLRLFKV